MRKLSNILNESVWGGMLNRSTGDQIRKEDDINLLDIDGLFNYVENNYSDRVCKIDSEEIRGFQGWKNCVVFPFDDDLEITITRFLDTGKIRDIDIMWDKNGVQDSFIRKLNDRFNICLAPRENAYIDIKDKDGSVSNQTYIDLLDFVLENERTDVLIESVWGGMLNRSTGDSIRKEDDPKHMNPEEFYEYLKNHYQLVKKNRYSKDIELYDDGTRIIVPIVEELKLEHKLNIYIDYKKKGDGIFIFGEANKYKDILINGGVELKQDGDVYTIVLDKGKTINEMFLICLDLLIEGIPSEERIIRKKVNESVWGGMLDRSVGDTIRKEDLIKDNETLRNIIKELYKEQGEGDTLDVSSLSKLINCDDFSKLFFNLNKVKQIIGLDTWDVSKVTNMRGVFYYCESLKKLNISNWDVSNVTDMSEMFRCCKSLKKLNISTWNVSNVTNMFSMFHSCKSLTELNISNWDVSNVTDMSFMFDGCKSLTELNISNWDVSNVTDMDYMFDGCDKLIKPKWYK